MGRSLALDAIALLVYPGLLTAAATGLLGEAAHARLLGAGGGARPLAGLLRRPPATALAAAALGALAATQLAAPFNPLDPVDRNVLVSAVCASAIVWLAWAWEPGEDGGLLFAGLAGALVALLTPAVLAQDLHPQVLSGLAVTTAVPAKICAAVLYLVSLPAVLGVLERGLPPAQRVWLWLPAGGLFASVFAGPAGDDLGGLLRFFAAAAAAVGVALAAGAWGRGLFGARRYAAVCWAFSGVTAAFAAGAALIH